MHAVVCSVFFLFAEDHLAMETEISSLRDQIASKERELSEARREFDHKAQQQKTLMQRYSPQAMATQLDRLANEADTQSETLVNDFLGSAPGSADIGEFSKEYLELRKRYHICNAKREVLLRQ
jgi:Modifier of rudimentary (Mod(r)) protein